MSEGRELDLRRIEEVLLDPRWEVGGIAFDGDSFVCLTIHHPRHGRIDALLPIAEARSLGSMLLTGAANIGDWRMGKGRGDEMA